MLSEYKNTGRIGSLVMYKCFTVKWPAFGKYLVILVSWYLSILVSENQTECSFQLSSKPGMIYYPLMGSSVMTSNNLEDFLTPSPSGTLKSLFYLGLLT